jgi:hypothetical protein
VSNFVHGILKSLADERSMEKGRGINKNAIGQSGFVMAMRAVTAKDLCRSIGLAVVVMTLTSVMGSI